MWQLCFLCLVNVFKSVSYFLLINPWNHSGKLPLWRMRGAWVSVNHFKASSLSLLSVFSPWTSPPHGLWSILTQPCINPRRQRRKLSTPVGRPKLPMLSVGPHRRLICLCSWRRHKMPVAFSTQPLFLFIMKVAVWHRAHFAASAPSAFLRVRSCKFPVNSRVRHVPAHYLYYCTVYYSNWSLRS